MEEPIYIIGHKNPDSDAICSAIAYAAFKKALGFNNYVPARCGNSNARINTVLDYFKVPLPIFISDVSPIVADIMIPIEKVKKINLHGTCAETLKIIDEHNVRAVPVVDSHNHTEGIISVFSLGEYFIPKAADLKRMRKITTTVNAIVASLNATPLHLHKENVLEELYVRVAAMSEESFGKFFRKEDAPLENSIVVVGDRKEIQKKAITQKVKLLVIAGNWPVDPDIIELAKENHVNLIVSQHDSATTAWIIYSAVPVKFLLQKDTPCFQPDEKLSKVKRKITYTPAPLFLVTDKDNHLLGVFSTTDILKPLNKRIILVDHNELVQAVDGAAEVQILEIIDHHRLGNPPTQAPIRFINEPVGSTSTIIANMFHTHQLQPSPQIAGILLGGIITDTLNLHGPTTTSIDRQMLSWLKNIAQVDPNDFANTVFTSGSVILTSSRADVIQSDSKVYTEGSFHYSVSQVEELSFENFWKYVDPLLQALENFRTQNNLNFSFLLVTNINTQNSLLAIQGDQDITDLISFQQINKYPIFDLPGIVSRKKQLIPYITSILKQLEPTS